MTFHEIQFPVEISYGSGGGPQRLTQIVSLKSGFEERNQVWAHSRRKYNASVGIRTIEHIHDVLQFWEARSGQLYGFRWKDWGDYKSAFGSGPITATDVILATGDGNANQFQLVKRYSDTNGEYVRPITKPVIGTVKLSVNDVELTSGWSVDATTGMITFDGLDFNLDFVSQNFTFGNAPISGAVIKAGFEFDVPARFNSPELNINIEAFKTGTMPSIEVIEIRV